MGVLLNIGEIVLKALGMTGFEIAIENLIEKTGFTGATRIKLMDDASTRSYERLVLGDKTAILMKAPKGNEDQPCPIDASDNKRLEMGWNAASRLAASRVEAFVAIAEFLREAGFSSPEIYGSDCDNGVAIIEDMGNDLFAEILKEEPQNEIELYSEAGLLLAKLHEIPVPQSLPSPIEPWNILDFDALALSVNIDLFVNWVPRFLGREDYCQETLAAWADIRSWLVGQILTHESAFTLRDYHAENMLWLPKRDGIARIGLLDFQDSVRGYRAWDFSMLLHDARRDVSKNAHDAAINAYVNANGCDEMKLRNEIDLQGAANILRIIGIFSRLIYRDKKEKYRAFMPRMVGHLNAVLQNPALSRLKAWIDEFAPLKELAQNV